MSARYRRPACRRRRFYYSKSISEINSIARTTSTELNFCREHAASRRVARMHQRFVSHCAIARLTRSFVWKSKSMARKSMSEPSQSSNRGGVRPGAGRPEGSVGPRRARVRRRRELIEIYTAALGGADKLSEGQKVDVKKAAGLVALSEDLRELTLQQGCGGPGALSALLRLESASARAVRALRLPIPDAAAPADDAWRKFLASQAAPTEGGE
jgi:hypothetical protein